MLPSLQEAIAAIKAGDKEKGRKLLADILQADLENEMAWLWMSSVATSNEERRKYLKRVLEINPDNTAAQRGLAKLTPKSDAVPAQPDKGLSSRLSSPPVEPPSKPAESSVEEPVAAPETPSDRPSKEAAIEKPIDVPAPASKSTADDVIAQFRGNVPPPIDKPIPPPIDEEEESAEPPTKSAKPAKPKGDGVVDFLNSERGIFTMLAATVAIVLALAACVVLNLVFQPLAQQLSPTVAAVIGTDTPTATFTPVTPSATPLPTSTPTPTTTPTLPPSPQSTPVVVDTPTVTATPTRTTTPDLSQQPAQVVGVVSGDTITVLIDGQEELVKYLSIDAPAVNDPVLGTEPVGEDALATNRLLVESRQVVLEKDISNRDERGRLLRYVFVDDVMVNEILLQQGAARLNVTPPDTKYGARLQDAEQSARDRGVGIWSVE